MRILSGAAFASAVLIPALFEIGFPASTPPTSPAEFDVPRELTEVPAESGLTSIRMVTWNIERGREVQLIGSELARDAVDLCLLQEVDWKTNRTGQADIGVQLAKRLHLNLSYAIEFEELGQESGQRAFIGQATLTRLPIRKSRVLRFRNQSGFWKPHSWIPSNVPLMQRRLGSRIALVTELEFARHLLVVYNAHLESRSMGSIQAAQLQEILGDLKKYPPKTAAIVAGDLNTKYFPSRYLKKLEREGFRSCTGERIERTHHVAMALDWIFARGPLNLEGGEVRRDFRGSDHYPVFAKLEAK
ncbi:MAG: endonuclease/exonuclease/phosphatase family protein [Acidobacteriaceae bacterium]|nr:endonuclease/exonuclease/phosphatase family protein [Acidobacteriaceae bacterium]MBV9779101.1 endonuclease/exonuclease/phosphatase family protein [Acidobacteriaceae bacterium]